MADRYVYVQQTEGRLYKVSDNKGGGKGSDNSGCLVWIVAGMLLSIGTAAWACF